MLTARAAANQADADYVGRDALRSLLARSVTDCRAGRGGILLLEGEAGIGKTRTLGVLEGLSASAGTRAVWGRCSEVPGAPPLLAWTEVLAKLGADAATVEVAEQDERAQFLVFRSVSDALLEGSRPEPLLVLLDDVHAADLASLRLLAFLSREVQEAPILIAAAYRHTDVPADGPVRRVLDEVRRRARVVRLEGLDAEEVARLAARASGASVHGEVARTVFERTLGNPLFAKQLVEFLVASGCDLAEPEAASEASRLAPAGVAAVLRDRLSPLAGEALEALRIASVVGRDFDADLLEGAGVAPESVASALDAAEAAGVLEADPVRPGSWRFPHVLFRDVLYDEQSATARRTAHRRVCDSIVARRDVSEDVWSTAAAHHAREALGAENAGAARELLQAAGGRALLRCAHEDAIAWFEAALRALELDPAAPEREAHALELRLALATARWRAGQPAAAREDYARALDLARSREDGAAFAEAAVGFVGRTDAVLGPEDEAAVLLEEALGRLGPEPSRLRVDTLTRLASALYFSDDDARRERVSLEAVACAEELGDPSALGYALTARRYVLHRLTDSDEREAIEARALRVLEGRPEDSATVIARYQAIVGAFERGDFTAVDQHLSIHAGLAERLREPFLVWQHAALEATRGIATGDLGQGEALALRARELGEEAESPNAFAWFAGQLYGLRRSQGRLAELEPVLDDLATRFPDVPGYAFARAEAWLALGREAEVRAFLVSAGGHGFRDLPQDLNWSSLVSIAARLLVALEERELAASLCEVMSRASGSCIVMPFASLWDGAFDLPLGQLATLLGRTEDARRLLAAAEALHARVGARAHLGETWLAQARSCSREGERKQAGALAVQAARLFHELGMPEAEKQAEALARPLPAARGGEAVHSWKRSGSRWRVRYGEDEAHFRDSLGMAYLGALLARPHESLHVLDLTARRAEAGGADSGELLDGRARAEVRARMNELAADLDEAEERNDPGRAEALRGELERLEEELAKALGLGGRARRVGDPVERARKSVYNRIQAALKAIEVELPDLAQHLRRNIRTGRTCGYAPETPLEWIVDTG